MDFGHLNVDELKVVAKYYKLEGYKNMRRHELVSMLLSHLNKPANYHLDNNHIYNMS